ncbi:MAG: hypothetical protein H3C64_02195 [Candidatus Kuenenia stuttgartiensis]|nr:hypothetical protein [Candidatus Kuenenia stuttgartiensis]
MAKLFRKTKPFDWITAAFIILFTFTAVNKLLDSSTFRIALVQSPLLAYYADFLGVAVPVTELVIVAMLIVSATRKIGIWLSLFLIIIFTFYISYLLLFVRDMPCNCGRILKSLSWKSQLTVNLLLIAITGYALFDLKRSKLSIKVLRESRKPA